VVQRIPRGLLLALIVIFSTLASRLALAAPEILLGNVASTTNVTARDNCANIVLGYSVYLDYINSQGGVRGQKIRLINKDDNLNPEKMMELSREFTSDKNVLALVGYLNTPGLVEMTKTDFLVQNRIAMIAPIGAFNATNFYPLRPGYNEEVEKLLQETMDTQKKRVALVYFNQAYGPSVFKYAAETAKKMNINVVATAGFETTPEKIDANIAAAADTLSKGEPDAVIMIIGGFGAYKFAKQFRQTANGSAQIYTLSTADPFQFVKIAGLENARGVVISQAMPYPQNNTLAVVREYQKLMKQYAPDKTPSFFSLEGFMGAKIAVEAIRRAGANPTREKIIAALNTMKDFDLGDFPVSYSLERRTGSKLVDLTIIGRNGTLYR
jgi:ABC-type branched-subunit amino acid transport system substrate-binding protein